MEGTRAILAAHTVSPGIEKCYFIVFVETF
jgi:hypothetical protein